MSGQQCARRPAQGLQYLDLLVVDDDAITLELIERRLKQSAVRYAVFSDPAQAMLALCMCVPRVLIVDFYMQGTDGLAFLKEVGSQHVAPFVENQYTDVYLCTEAQMTPAIWREVQAAGVSAVLGKSVLHDASRLVELVSLHQKDHLAISR